MESTSGKTIQFYLPHGEPRGIRIAEITTRTVQAVLIPRSILDRAKDRPEVSKVGVYLLIGTAEEGAKPSLYVGQSENPFSRLEQHTKDETKAFWETAVIFVSRTDSFTLTHVRYLEYHCQVVAKEAGRYALRNKQEAEPFVTEPMKADLLDAFDTMRILVSALGHPVFDTLTKPAARELFYCKGKEAAGTGEYLEDGFLVHAGSIARPDLTPSGKKTVAPTRERLVAGGVLVTEGDKLIFKEDSLFKTPSGAAMTILGKTANGWVEWKSKDGKTLDELKRQQEVHEASTDREGRQ